MRTSIFLYIMFIFLPSRSSFDEPEFDKKPFDRLAHNILDQAQISEMNDFNRYTKNLNGYSIRFDEKASKDDDFTIYIDRLEDSLKIDKALVEQIRSQLEDTKLSEFYRSNNSILFRCDGMMGNSRGYFYSSAVLQNDAITFTFQHYSVQIFEPVDEHWAKVNIHP